MGLLWNRMWGYEDDAPVAGQPFYDIVELYGDFKRATNDFSDYLEKEINDWAKGLDEDYKNRELAKPASMRSDFGDAITGLTSGKEDNLSFGGKAGAFLRGLLVDGCGKLLIKDTLLAASSPCDTAKSVMETVKLVGDMDEEDFSKIAKEIKTTWDEASEEEKLNYTGQAGAIVADFLIAKKLKLSKQVKVVETGVKTGSKVDNLLEAGVKASSKADDVAEAGAKASSKADDAAKAGAKASSKANDTAKTAGQTTAITVVKENSGTNGSGVKISGEKPKTDVNGIKTTGKSNNKPDEIKAIGANSNKAGTDKKDKIKIDQSVQGIPKKAIVDTHGFRNDLPLTPEQTKELIEYAKRLGFPEDKIHVADMINSSNTGMLYGEILVINNDVLPTNLPTKNPNSLVSGKATIAHEIIGHYETTLKGTAFSQYDIVDNTLIFNPYNYALDEAQASIRAAKFAPDLTFEERVILIKDALQRLKKENLKIKEVREYLDILER